MSTTPPASREFARANAAPSVRRTLVVTCPTADATRALGAHLSRLLSPGSVLLLSGPLGAGKTTFTQGLARGLGVSQPVVSPTFVLVREYAPPDRHQPQAAPAGRQAPTLAHLDFYRLHGDAEALDLGLDDYWTRGDIVVIEWPEMAPGAVPADALRVRFEIVMPAGRHPRGTPPAPDDAPSRLPPDATDITDLPRRLSFEPSGPHAARVLADLAACWSDDGHVASH